MVTKYANSKVGDPVKPGSAVDQAAAQPVGPEAGVSQCHLLDAAAADSFENLLRQLAQVAVATGARLVAVCTADSGKGESPVSIRVLCSTAGPLSEPQQKALALVTQQSASGPKVKIQRVAPEAPDCLMALVVPGQPGQCLVGWFDRPAAIQKSTLITLEAIASQIGAWQGMQRAATKEAAATRLAALTELLGRLETAQTPEEACQTLADEMQSYLDCCQTVVGLRAEGKTVCRVAAISDVDAFHPHSDEVRTAQSALQEAILKSDLSIWPAVDESKRYGLKAHEQYAASCQAEVVISSPLRDDRGVVRGAWLIAGNREALLRDDIMAMLRSAPAPVASVLHLLERAQVGWMAGLARWLRRHVRQRRGQVILALLVILAGAMFAPFPYRVRCDCQLEPVTRRFVAAPFAGPLKVSLVEPGDLVTQDQLLAQMDGREIHWELAGVQAELYRATTERAGHVASHQAGEAEVARHEIDRLRFREELLKSRDQDLDICSPVDGMVVSGDLKDVEGMPLEAGETLFEVAPLDAMVVEVAVQEDDMPYVRSGMQVRITFDAFPLQDHRAEVDRIHPRSELFEEQNVFIAEVPLANPTQTLLPGMRGRARIAAGRAPLGWILFRRPAVAMLQWLGW